MLTVNAGNIERTSMQHIQTSEFPNKNWHMLYMVEKYSSFSIQCNKQVFLFSYTSKVMAFDGDPLNEISFTVRYNTNNYFLSAVDFPANFLNNYGDHAIQLTRYLVE